MIRLKQKLVKSPIQPSASVEESAGKLAKAAESLADIQRQRELLSKLIEEFNTRIAAADELIQETRNLKDDYELFAIDVEESVGNAVTEARTTTKNAQSEIERSKTIQKGEKGEDAKVDYEKLVQDVLTRVPKPKDGTTPIKGVDYFDGTPGKPGAKGKDAVLDPDEVFNTLFHPEKGKKLSLKHIDGLDQTIEIMKNHISRGYQYGAGDTVEAGSGISIVVVDGKKQISATSTGISSETPTGAVNGSNTSYTVANEPLFVIIDGMFRISGQGYTYAALTISVDPLAPPVQYIKSYYSA